MINPDIAVPSEPPAPSGSPTLPPPPALPAPTAVPSDSANVPEISWRNGQTSEITRNLAEETAIAITYNDLPYAVMMATPRELDDFGIGFTLGEGIAARLDEIRGCEVVAHEAGVELRLVLAPAALERMLARRRSVTGYAGCGLCGLESLAQALRPIPAVAAGGRIAAEALRGAMAGLAARQTLNAATRAVHAAAFWQPGHGILHVCEDVGRHNALDKLIGALARAGVPANGGAVLLTSRISIELVQKAATAGVTVLAAVSAPTALAVRAAAAAGMTLVAVARADGFGVFSHPGRIAFELCQTGQHVNL